MKNVITILLISLLIVQLLLVGKTILKEEVSVNKYSRAEFREIVELTLQHHFLKYGYVAFDTSKTIFVQTFPHTKSFIMYDKQKNLFYHDEISKIYQPPNYLFFDKIEETDSNLVVWYLSNYKMYGLDIKK